jgi:hypothetical protein
VSDELRTTENAGVLPGGELGMAARTLVEERIRGLGKAIGRNLAPVDLVVKPANPQVRQHLFEEACELYWNELSWEEITDEELVGASSTGTSSAGRRSRTRSLSARTS